MDNKSSNKDDKLANSCGDQNRITNDRSIEKDNIEGDKNEELDVKPFPKQNETPLNSNDNKKEIVKKTSECVPPSTVSKRNSKSKESDDDCVICNTEEISHDARICDYIILDDDDDVDPLIQSATVKTEPQQEPDEGTVVDGVNDSSLSVGEKCDSDKISDTKEVIKIEHADGSNEKDMSDTLENVGASKKRDDSKEKKSSELASASPKDGTAEKGIDDTSVPLGKKDSSEKLSDSLVLTFDEKELGEISEVEITENKSREEQNTPDKDSPGENNHKKNKDRKKSPEHSREYTSSKITDHGQLESSNKTEKKGSEKREKKSERDDATQTAKGITSESPKSRVLWVSNLKRSTRASDLKQHLNKFGKVITTKIVTDGKRCFGYVVMENQKDVANCINNLDGTDYDEVKITLSTNKPLVDNKNKTKDTESVKDKTEEGNKTENKKHSDKAKESKRKPKVESHVKRKRSHSNDPLTTRFSDTKSNTSSRDDRIRKDYLRERREKERLEMKLRLEIQKSREESQRLREREEQQRRMELKLEQERKRLRVEKELLEKERREIMQLEQEKRKIEKEKMNLMQQKIALEKSMRDTKRRSLESERKMAKKRREEEEDDDERNYDKFTLERRKTDVKSSDRYPDPGTSKDGKLLHGDRRSTFYGDNGKGGHEKEQSALGKHPSRKEDKGFGCVVPPPPKLSGDFDIPKRKQLDENVRYYARKPTIAAPAFKQEYSYRRADFDKNKLPPVSRGQEMHRDERPLMKDDHYGHSGREATQRMPWNPNSSEQWKIGPEAVGTFPMGRYSNTSYPPVHYGSSRMPPPVFYNTPPANLGGPDYNKYYYNHHTSRKY